METKEIEKLIKKYGHCERMAQGKIPGLYWVICQKCGKKISSGDSGLGLVGFTITKRGTANFWHGGCKGSVWDSRIRWKEEDNGKSVGKSR